MGATEQAERIRCELAKIADLRSASERAYDSSLWPLFVYIHDTSIQHIRRPRLAKAIYRC